MITAASARSGRPLMALAILLCVDCRQGASLAVSVPGFLVRPARARPGTFGRGRGDRLFPLARKLQFLPKALLGLP